MYSLNTKRSGKSRKKNSICYLYDKGTTCRLESDSLKNTEFSFIYFILVAQSERKEQVSVAQISSTCIFSDSAFQNFKIRFHVVVTMI